MSLREDVSQFAEAHLDDRALDVRDRKIIHDALWGTQLLFRHEIALIDTPLFQRLRYLHQTGFTFLTYPSARHTRFEHSLGVLHQASRLAGHLREKYGDREIAPVNDSVTQRIRLAAILHDCSHGPFSHTSEEVFKNDPEMASLTGAQGQFESVSASEVLAYFILKSDPFTQYYTKLSSKYELSVPIDELINLIHGQGKLTLTGYQTDVINGPFDADKLDYIPRDSRFGGLPLSIDIDRLWYSTEIQTIREGDLPGVSQDMRRLVINSAGASVLEQIVFARMGLTANIYHHHKVRACDSMFKGVIEYCRQNDVPLCDRPLQSAADFLYLTDYSVLTESERSPDNVVREMVKDIMTRRLFRRALVVSMRSVDGQSGGGEQIASQLHTLIMLRTNATGALELREVAKQIWEEAGRPGRPEQVWLDFPEPPKMKDLSQTIVNTGTPDRPKFRVLQDFIPLEQWAKQYLLNRWRGHVFCRPEYVERISKAAKAVLEEKYDLSFNDFAVDLAHL